MPSEREARCGTCRDGDGWIETGMASAQPCQECKSRAQIIDLPRDKEWGRTARESLLVFARLAQRDRHGHMNDTEVPEFNRRVDVLVKAVAAKERAAILATVRDIVEGLFVTRPSGPIANAYYGALREVLAILDTLREAK